MGKDKGKSSGSSVCRACGRATCQCAQIRKLGKEHRENMRKNWGHH